jgi:hypothetical protein
MHQLQNQLSGVGLQQARGENSMVVNPTARLAALWNSMVDDNTCLHDFLINDDDYKANYIGSTIPPLQHVDYTNIDSLMPNQKLFIKQTWL